MKTCSKCKRILDTSMFFRSSQAKDGLSYQCKDCRKSYGTYPESKALWAKNNKERVLEIGREWNKNNPEKKLKSQSRYRKANREVLRAKDKEYSNSHKKEISAYGKVYSMKNKERLMELARIRRRNRTPQRKVSDAMSCGIRECLKGNKKRRHWESLVSYNMDSLKKHIESNFVTGMTWDNYGKWHIDHIIPLSFFRYTSPEDVEFKMCWRLENLQPLWAEDNIAKSNKIFKVA